MSSLHLFSECYAGGWVCDKRHKKVSLFPLWGGFLPACYIWLYPQVLSREVVTFLQLYFHWAGSEGCVLGFAGLQEFSIVKLII